MFGYGQSEGDCFKEPVFRQFTLAKIKLIGIENNASHLISTGGQLCKNILGSELFRKGESLFEDWGLI